MSDGGIVFDTKIDTSEFKKGASEQRKTIQNRYITLGKKETLKITSYGKHYPKQTAKHQD